MRQLRLLNLCNLLTRYRDGLALQDAVVESVRAGSTIDTLIVLQHHPVYTIGKRGRHQDFKIPAEELQGRGIDIHIVPRGGEVTWHGPGQLVAYPITSLRAGGRGARAFVEGLEDAVVATCGAYNIAARGRVPGRTGVWVGEEKIAAIGVKLSHGVSSHGLALNVVNDLTPYDAIVPCGITDKSVTSIAAQLAAMQAQQQGQGHTGAQSPPDSPSSSDMMSHTHVSSHSSGGTQGCGGSHVAAAAPSLSSVTLSQNGALLDACADVLVSKICAQFKYDDVVVDDAAAWWARVQELSESQRESA